MSEECEKAFQELKKYLASPPLLSTPVPKEELLLYLAVSQSAVSSALVRKEHGITTRNWSYDGALLVALE